MSDLDKITADLFESYNMWKDGEKSKNTDKDRFFEAVNNEIRKEKPAEKLVETGRGFCGATEEKAREQIMKQHPTWTIDAIRPCENGWEAILVENPKYTPYTYINRDLDPPMAFQKQVSAGSVYVDDETLQENDPELWVKVTVVPNEDWIKNVMYHCNVDGHDLESELEEFMRILPGAPQRQLKPLDSLDPEDLAQLSQYIYQGSPTVKLAAPRKAKDEELD